MSNERTYDDNVKIWKHAYSEIKDVCQKYAIEFENKHGFYDISRMLREAESHLRQYEFYEKYGIRLNEPITSTDWSRIDDYRDIGLYDGTRRDISWPDDGEQPKDEVLYRIHFSSGAYIFGDDYPKEFFQDFFNELKSYKPKYVDSANKSLYFELDKAKGIHEDFTTILNKYREKNQIDSKHRKIQALKQQIKKLEQ